MKKHEAVMTALFFAVPLLVVAGFAVLIVLATFTALTGQTMPPASVGPIGLKSTMDFFQRDIAGRTFEGMIKVRSQRRNASG